MTSSEASAITVHGLSHWYEGPRGVALQALDGVDLTVRTGEFVAVVGPSGCGKTTLLRALAGLLQPTSGHLALHGRPPGHAAVARRVGLLAQDPGLLPWRTVEANVALPLEVTRISRGMALAARVRALLERVGVGAFAQYHPRELSGGLRQRVALARALAHEPDIWLMDEPFGALDELSREVLRTELLAIWEQQRVSVVFVTHAIAEAVLLADRVVVLSGRPGRVVSEIAITLDRPRASEASGAYAGGVADSPAFQSHVRQVREALAGAGI